MLYVIYSVESSTRPLKAILWQGILPPTTQIIIVITDITDIFALLTSRNRM